MTAGEKMKKEDLGVKWKRGKGPSKCIFSGYKLNFYSAPPPPATNLFLGKNRLISKEGVGGYNQNA